MNGFIFTRRPTEYFVENKDNTINYLACLLTFQAPTSGDEMYMGAVCRALAILAEGRRFKTWPFSFRQNARGFFSKVEKISDASLVL